MRLTLRNGRFVAVSSYDERAVPKDAGFRWDRTAKIWFTSDVAIASKLARYADETCRDRLASVATMRKATLAQSRAAHVTADAPIIPAPAGLAYLPFQLAGIAYALPRPATLLGDEMGLGKTIQAVGVINADPSVQRVLAVVPASLKINWQRELTRWLTRPLTVGIANGGDLPVTDVVIVNYEILTKHSAALHATEWDAIIVDEAHRLKSPSAQRTAQIFGTDNYIAKRQKLTADKIVQPIQARRKLLLTGTPIANRPMELFPLLHYLDPVAWPNAFTFGRRYCDAHEGPYGWDFSGASHLDELQEKLRATLMVRRLKAGVLTELPAKRRQVIELPANGCAAVIRAENAAWDRNEAAMDDARVRVEMAKASPDPDDYDAAMRALRERSNAAFMELSKLRHDTAVAKVPAVIEHITATLESVDKIVVMCHHHDVGDAIMAALGEADVTAVLHRGGLGDVEKQSAVDRFQSDPTVRVFVGSIQASGVGITLTAASTVLFAELDWVPGNVTQAEDRCHRIGQNDAVLVQHLVLDGSLDARMAHILVGKQAVLEAALDATPDATEPLLPARQQAATAETPRSRIDGLAASLSETQRAAAHAALRLLARLDPDHAGQLNDAGFNRLDGRIGYELAEMAVLSPRQAALGWLVVRKYRRQIPADLLATLLGE